MLYSEFTDRTGATIGAEIYHKLVEPHYYDYPGDKDEYCRDWLVRQMALMTETLVDCQKRSRKPDWTDNDQLLWDVVKKQFAIYAEKLTKLNIKLGYNQ